MDELLHGLLRKTCIVYIDDVIIWGKTIPELMKNLDEVLSRFRSQGFTLKASKCKFFCTSLVYLGYTVSREGILPDPSKIEVIKTLPVPRNIRGIRQFLGICNYYRRFVKGFSEIATPINNLLKAGETFKWTPECQKSFEKLKETLMQSPLLIYPDFLKPFKLLTDASTTGLGVILAQDWDGRERVVAYGSRSLNRAEKNYSTTDRECLAIVWGIEQYRPYLFGQKFEVITDHSALKWLFAIREPTGRIARWVMKLQEYDFIVTHRSGKTHSNADTLSRIHEDQVLTISMDTLNRLSEIQRRDQLLGLQYQALIDGKTLDDPDIRIKDGYLVRQWIPSNARSRNEL